MTSTTTASAAATVEATVVRAVAPLYITIGPPCAGKTTWIRRKQQQQQQHQHQQHQDQKQDSKVKILYDVSIDDQDGVYVPVPTAWFFNTTTTTTTGSATATAAVAARRLILHGKTAFDRIHKDQMELVTILSRLANYISKETCESQLKNAITTKEAANGILAAVEDYIITAARPSSSIENTTRSGNHCIQLPETIDLFVVEALFRPDPAGTTTTTTTAATSAIERASQALRHHAVSDAIVWGNTNCRITDYQDALQLAAQQGRPVYFVVYSEHDNDDPDQDPTTETTLLHAKNLQELFQRSIARLVQTGRYVPANVIMDMRRRCLEMTTRTLHQHQQQQQTGMELECHLARLAQFELDPVTRTVRPLPSKRRRSNDHQQQQQHQPRYHDHLYRNNPLQYRGGVHSTAAGLFQQSWRGGIMHGRNHQYGNYHTTATTTTTTMMTNSHSNEGHWARKRPDGNYGTDTVSNATTTTTSRNPRGGQWDGRKKEDGRK